MRRQAYARVAEGDAMQEIEPQLDGSDEGAGMELGRWTTFGTGARILATLLLAAVVVGVLAETARSVLDIG
ncbi:MAG: hypothetical protein KY461_15320 [Actinobacteria bacterium]|nr:hypothetical protein [Actinomycetota bacterium]